MPKPKTKKIKKTKKKIVTKGDAIFIYKNIHLLKPLAGKKLGLAMTENRRNLELEMKDLNEQNIPSDAFNKYDNARMDLCRKHSEKDEDGNPVTYDDDGVDKFKMSDQGAFDKALIALRSRHKKAIDQNNKSIDEFNELLKEPSSTKLSKVSMDIIPENATGQQMDILYLMIQ